MSIPLLIAYALGFAITLRLASIMVKHPHFSTMADLEFINKTAEDREKANGLLPVVPYVLALFWPLWAAYMIVKDLMRMVKTRR